MRTSEKTKGPSLGKIQVKVSRQRSPYALKVEEFDTRWDVVLLLRESAQLNTVFDLCDMHGDSSEDIGSPLSEVENNVEKKYSSETPIAKLWRQKWENWNRSSGQES